MRSFLLTVLLLMFSGLSQVFAQAFEVVTVPVSMYKTAENYYSFQNPDEIFASDIVAEFNSSFKVHSPELTVVKAKLNSDELMKTRLYNSLKAFDKTNKVDYLVMKQFAKNFNANSVLLISAVCENPKNKVQTDVWESLNVMSAFSVNQPLEMRVEAVLLDNVNDLVMWSSVYTFQLSDKSGKFQAKNYAQAVEHLIKLQMFSKDVLAKTVADNVTLRFYPKSIRPVDVKPTGKSIDAGLLKYNKNVPTFSKPEKQNSDSEGEFNEKEFGELIFGL